MKSLLEASAVLQQIRAHAEEDVQMVAARFIRVVQIKRLNLRQHLLNFRARVDDIFYHLTSQKFDDRAGCELALGEVNAEVRFIESSHDPEDVLVAFLQSMAVQGWVLPKPPS